MSEAISSSVGDGIEAGTARWTFGGDTPTVFTEHVRRSVPLYEEGHDLILRLSDYFVRDGSVCYDLGASTGVLLAQLAKRHADKDIHWIGVDVVEGMVDVARTAVAPLPARVDILLDDITTMDLERTDLIVAYYTIQFVHPSLRQEIFDKMYEALHWGGALLLFEKVRSPDARFQDIATGIYNDFKVEQGYSEEEILGKSRSLRGVLEPFSEQGNLDLLHRAGFVDIMPILKWVCFEGFLAIK